MVLILSRNEISVKFRCQDKFLKSKNINSETEEKSIALVEALTSLNSLIDSIRCWSKRRTLHIQIFKKGYI